MPRWPGWHPDADLLGGAARRCRRCRDRLTTVLGASAALGDHLARHPADWRLLAGDAPVPAGPVSELRAELLAAVGADPGGREPEASAADGDPATRLRVGLPAAAAPAGRRAT